MLFAIVMGTLGGTALAIYASRWLLDAMAKRYAHRIEQVKTIKVAGLIFGAIGLAPAIFLSVMGGGSTGMHYAGVVADALGIGAIGHALVLAIEVIAAITVIATINTALGAILGVMFARSLHPDKT